MNGKSKRSSTGINVGSTSIVMVFSVLCLTVFAVLSFITARSELDLAERSAASVTAYYAADSAAVDVYNALLAGNYEDNGGALLACGTRVERLEDNGAERLCYSIEIDDMQELYVELVNGDAGFSTAAWVVRDTGLWVADDSLDVMLVPPEQP